MPELGNCLTCLILRIYSLCIISNEVGFTFSFLFWRTFYKRLHSSKINRQYFCSIFAEGKDFKFCLKWILYTNTSKRTDNKKTTFKGFFLLVSHYSCQQAYVLLTTYIFLKLDVCVCVLALHLAGGCWRHPVQPKEGSRPDSQPLITSHPPSRPACLPVVLSVFSVHLRRQLSVCTILMFCV